MAKMTLRYRLNIYYLILEKMNAFAEESKYDITNAPGAQIASDYEASRTDAWHQIENLNITKRLISVGTFQVLFPTMAFHHWRRE
jgi:hypothetical protein